MMSTLKALRWPLLIYLCCEAANFMTGQRIYRTAGAPEVTTRVFAPAPVALDIPADMPRASCVGGNHEFYLGGASVTHTEFEREKWVISTDAENYEHPSVCMADDDGTVYVPLGDRHDERAASAVFVFDSEGKQLWSATASGRIESVALANAGEIVVSGYRNNPRDPFLEKFSAKGESIWQIATEDVLLGVGPDGTIYCRRNQGGLVARQPNGIERWLSNPTTSDIVSPAFDSQGNIYITDWEGIFALDKRGVLRWQRTARSPQPIGYQVDDKKDAVMENAMMGGGAGVNQPAIGDDDTIYFAARSLYAFTKEGELKWVFTPDTLHHYSDPRESTYFNRTPILAQDGTIYITTYDHQLYALDRNGKPLWRRAGAEFDDFEWLYLAPSGKLRLAHAISDTHSDRHLHSIIFNTSQHGALMKHAWPTRNHDFGNTRHRKAGE